MHWPTSMHLWIRHIAAPLHITDLIVPGVTITAVTRTFTTIPSEYGYILKGYRLLDWRKCADIREKALNGIGDRKARDKKERAGRYLCPLNFDGRCILYSFRPMICRLHGIPHEFQTINPKVFHAPGCDLFTAQHGNMEYFKFDRTPFYTRMAKLESQLKQAIQIDSKLKMTIAEMIVSFQLTQLIGMKC